MLWREWLAPLKYYEPSLIMTYPGSDLPRRSAQLFENPEFIQRELGEPSVEVVVLDYRTQRWANGQELLNAFGHAKKKTRIVWIFGFEEILREGRNDLVIALLDIYRDIGQRLVLVCEAHFYDQEFEKLLLSLPSFEPRITLHPSYEVKQLIEFIAYLANKWGMPLSEEIQMKIISSVGHSLQLIKSVVWYLRDKGVEKLGEALESEEVLWLTRSLWQKLSESEKQVVLTDVYGLRISEKLALSQQYVKQMRLLDIPPLKSYVQKYVGNPMQVQVVQDQLLIGGKDYSSYFTKKQKTIIKMVTASPGVCLAREAIIEAIWGDDIENGSDWALDSQVNRLRQRLQEVGIGKKHLVTRRRKGLVWLPQ